MGGGDGMVGERQDLPLDPPPRAVATNDHHKESVREGGMALSIYMWWAWVGFHVCKYGTVLTGIHSTSK